MRTLTRGLLCLLMLIPTLNALLHAWLVATTGWMPVDPAWSAVLLATVVATAGLVALLWE